MPDPSALPTRLARSNGIELAYDSFGDDGAPPLLLIAGLGQQLIDWDAGFCAQLAGHGLRVVRFDNRDAGRSTRFTAAGVPHIKSLMFSSLFGLRPAVPYLLRDMADDAVGLLDALGIDSAHVVGASMGGAIAQEMALRHAPRVRTLTSVMATTGSPLLPPPTAEALALLLSRPPADAAAYARYHAHLWRVLRGPGSEEDAARDAERGRLFFLRGVRPGGTARQLAAVIGSGDRTAALRSLRVPTLVVHGEADPLVHVAAGVATAAAIPGARLLRVPGMGHALPSALWPQLAQAIASHAANAANA